MAGHGGAGEASHCEFQVNRQVHERRMRSPKMVRALIDLRRESTPRSSLILSAGLLQTSSDVMLTALIFVFFVFFSVRDVSAGCGKCLGRLWVIQAGCRVKQLLSACARRKSAFPPLYGVRKPAPLRSSTLLNRDSRRSSIFVSCSLTLPMSLTILSCASCIFCASRI